jgi:hypothetical protein
MRALPQNWSAARRITASWSAGAPDPGQLRAERTVDRWEFYEAGALARIEEDVDLDGVLANLEEPYIAATRPCSEPMTLWRVGRRGERGRRARCEHVQQLSGARPDTKPGIRHLAAGRGGLQFLDHAESA